MKTTVKKILTGIQKEAEMLQTEMLTDKMVRSVENARRVQ